MSKRFSRPILVAALTLVAASAARGWQTPRWAEGFEGAVLGVPDTLAVHDAGTGQALYAFGSTGIAIRYDGSSWSVLPTPPARVVSSASFQLGGTPLLVAASAGPNVLGLANGVWSTIGTAFQLAQPPAVNN